MKKSITIICIVALIVSIISFGAVAETISSGFARYDMAREEYEAWASTAFMKVSEWHERSKQLNDFPLQMESVTLLLDEFRNNSSKLEKDEYYVYWYSDTLKVIFDERLIGATVSAEFGSEDKRTDIDVLFGSDWHNGVCWFQVPDGYSFEEISALRINFRSDSWPDEYGHAWFQLTYDVTDDKVISRLLETEMDDGRFIVNWTLERDEEDNRLYLGGLFYDLAVDAEFCESFDPVTGKIIED